MGSQATDPGGFQFLTYTNDIFLFLGLFTHGITMTLLYYTPYRIEAE